MNAAKAVYDRVPLMRPVMATLQGARLRWWRYGSDTEELVERALERETWAPPRWESWLRESLAAQLTQASVAVPYYRALWAAGRNGADPALLKHWPVLEKDELRTNPRAFLAAGWHPRRMLHKQTSGTTGKPLDLWSSRRFLHAWYALFEARCRRWYNVSSRDRYAMLGGQVVTPVRQHEPPFWIWNAALGQLYLSGHHISPANVRHYAAALRQYRVKYLLGFPSLLNALAQGLLRAGIGGLRMTVVICNGEPVLDHQRRAIAEAFGCPVRETYGMGEAVAGASECEHGRLHLWPDAGVVEVVDGDPEGNGDLLCTSLLNREMPLIRYRIGDRGKFAAKGASCPCGRTLPVFEHITGRCNDVLLTRDGRAVFWLNPVFYGLPLVEAQIVQERLGEVLVRYVPAPGFDTHTANQIAARLRERLGDTQVRFDRMDAIPRGSNGKFRAIICLAGAEEQQGVS
jgi:phenylacetate-CoA ligase